ncbi:MAG: DUF1015 domain-containing protein [Deltaproteobacteria bacterium]|nr:DUF1015 domain-containing protein [Deltaproteobacteria bacterium]
MAEIAPVRGILYNPAKVDVSRVLAPPYDVISEEDRGRLEARDPYNCVRLILPRGEGDAKYGAAAKILHSWLDDGVLKRDSQHAIYRYNQVFTISELGHKPVTRRGFIAAVRLHRFDEGVIMPHERTLRGPKEDRLKLMRATRAHFSQIFGLYSDPDRETDRAFGPVENNPPDLEGTTPDGTLHQLWRVTDRVTLAKIGRVLAPLKIYIADGHHRYETMLALRDEFRVQAGSAVPASASTEHATMFLANMDDPGLVVLPTHRLIHGLQSFDLDSLLGQARAAFELVKIEEGARDAAKLKAILADKSRERPTFAAVTPGRADAWLFSLRVEPEAAGLSGPRALTTLDVTILHSLVLERMLGIDREAQEAQRNIVYVKDTRDALSRIERAEAQVGFVMHPTRVEQVRAIADCHEVMPQKSTFFYPKIASGLVVNPLDPVEILPSVL